MIVRMDHRGRRRFRRMRAAACWSAMLVSSLPAAPALAQERPRPDAAPEWLASVGVPLRRAQGEALRSLTRPEIAREKAATIEAILRTLPELDVGRREDGGTEVRIEPSPLPDGAPCHVAIYINGGVLSLGAMTSGVGGVGLRTRRMRLGDVVSARHLDALELFGPDYRPVAGEPACGLLLLWSEELREQVDAPFVGTVRGEILEESTGQPVARARVRLEGMDRETVTDASGTFSIGGVPPGRHELAVTVEGAVWNRTIDVRAFAVTIVDVTVAGRPAVAGAAGRGKGRVGTRRGHGR